MTPNKHVNSRIVTIFRAGSTLSRAQGAGVDDFFSASKQSIGSYYDSVNSQKVGSGLTFKEESLLLPVIIDIPSDDREFRKKVTDFYAELTTPIPYGTGVSLEIGLEDNNEKPVSKDNMPIKIMDYIRYKHAIGHPWCGKSKEEAEGDQTVAFYVFDKTAIQGKSTKKIAEMDAAMQIYLQVKKDITIVDQLLTLLGVDPRTFTGKNRDGLKIEALREKVEIDPNKFIETYNEGHLEIRYDITSMINTKVLKTIGSRIIDGETDKLLGNTMEEVIYWFKDEENSMAVIALKARLQEALLSEPETVKKRTILT